MYIINAKINKANGRTLGFSLFLNGDVIEALGIHGDTITLDVKVENGEIILMPQ